MISTEEKNKWLEELTKYSLIKEFDQKNCEENILLGNLASIAAWSGPVLDSINIFFPMFTPHNYSLHIRTVIDTLNWIIGENVKENLNIYELFCLISASFSHDVGMSVSKKEIKEIKNDSSFLEFRIKVLDGKKIIKSEDDIIREWVRQNHYMRSANKISEFIEVELSDPSYGIPISRVVEGHGLNPIEIIENGDYFTKEYPVGTKKIVNIQALIAYLRLADLFDCTKSRTPFVLYDFIDPTDPISKDEWERHLSTLTISPDSERKKILITAKTTDPKIYIKINNFIKNATKELMFCRNVLSHQDKKYKIDFETIKPIVTTVGFESVELYFEINKDSVLDLLMGNNLYSNPMTCIRELLQNSVDACRQRSKLESEYSPEIKINFYEKDEELFLEVIDNGVGITESVAQNFLLSIGKNYYNSETYLSRYSQNKRIEPIAKFGIGFLSCFMVGDNIEVITKNESCNGFSLEFNGIHNYIVKRINNDKKDTGTSVRIKINKLIKKDFKLIDNIEEFIGLLEIPIIINNRINNSDKILLNDFKVDSDSKFNIILKPQDDKGLKGFIEPYSQSIGKTKMLSQQGFKIDLDSVLPDGTRNFLQIVDISGESIIPLTTSREKIIDLKKVEKIKNYIAKKIIDELYIKFSDKKKDAPTLRYAWFILYRNTDTKFLYKQKIHLEKLCKSLNINGYFNSEEIIFNVNELIDEKINFEILPYNLKHNSYNEIKKYYNPEDIFIFHSKEVFYSNKIHDFLNLLTDSIGMPIWVPNLNTHIWRYKVKNKNYGDYREILGKYETSFPFGPSDLWQIDYTVDAPDIYYGTCNSPYFFFQCPFSEGIYINTGIINNPFIKDALNSEESIIFTNNIQNIIDDYAIKLLEDDMIKENKYKLEVNIDVKSLLREIFRHYKINNNDIIKKLVEPLLFQAYLNR